MIPGLLHRLGWWRGGEKGKYVRCHVDEKGTNGTQNSPIPCRQGEAGINIGTRQPSQMFLMEMC